MKEVQNATKFLFKRYYKIVQRHITNDRDEITTCCIGEREPNRLC